jgi:hypothetical protein
MLDTAVTFLAREINLYVKRRTSSDIIKVVPGSLTDDTGKWAVAEGNIGLALINVEEERVFRAQVPERKQFDDAQVVRQPELKLNLYLMFAVRHSDYGHALRYLSHVLTFFQAHPSFTPDEFPGLDSSIERLNVELLSYGPEQLNQVWTYLGTKYLPSAVYRVRMVVVQDAEPQAVEQPINILVNNLHDR